MLKVAMMTAMAAGAAALAFPNLPAERFVKLCFDNGESSIVCKGATQLWIAQDGEVVARREMVRYIIANAARHPDAPEFFRAMVRENHGE